MNTDTYDQVQVPKDVVGTAAPYLQEDVTVKLSLHGVIGRDPDAAAGDP